jgi:NitT/TauT family transport system ATP-binding protein
VPTSYPKASPTEALGLLVLLESHKGSEDVALLADDLDLEIDEILPALELAELLQLVKVTDGRASFTDLGRRFVAASIRDRKSMLREQLKRTTLFRTLLRALETAPDHRLSEEQFAQLLAFTPALADEALQNIVNWGRYTELFRYDAENHQLVARRPPPAKAGGAKPPPASPPEGSGEPPAARKPAGKPPEVPSAGPTGVAPVPA